MIERQQTHYDWHFTYLGANQDSFAEAGGMGIRADGVADYSMDCVPACYAATSQGSHGCGGSRWPASLCRMRLRRRRGRRCSEAGREGREKGNTLWRIS